MQVQCLGGDAQELTWSEVQGDKHEVLGRPGAGGHLPGAGHGGDGGSAQGGVHRGGTKGLPSQQLSQPLLGPRHPAALLPVPVGAPETIAPACSRRAVPSSAQQPPSAAWLAAEQR